MLLTRRATPSKKRREEGDDNDSFLENGSLSLTSTPSPSSRSSAFSSSSNSDYYNDNYADKTSSASSGIGIVRQLQFDDGKHIVISMASVNMCLKNMIIWGSLLYVGYQLGLTSSMMSTTAKSHRQQSSNKKSIPIPASAKWLFKKPPTLKQMYEFRNCESYLATYNSNGERIDSKSLPIYTEEQWASFRKLWRDQGGQDPSQQYKTGDRRQSKAPPNLIPPFKAGQTKDGKGRGVFATRDIKKGEMTYGGTKNYIFFTTGHDYRRFLDALDDETACDIMKFTWPQKGLGPKGESVIWGPMDDNALQNDGGRERANTGCPPFTHCGKFDEYALRDIKKGEEILCDYGNFFSLNFLEFDKWKEFGL